MGGLSLSRSKAVREPPHTQPESSPTTRFAAQIRAQTHAEMTSHPGSGVALCRTRVDTVVGGGGLPFHFRSTRPSMVQTRNRVSTLIVNAASFRQGQRSIDPVHRRTCDRRRALGCRVRPTPLREQARESCPRSTPVRVRMHHSISTPVAVSMEMGHRPCDEPA